MATETELERLVVRLTGDSKMYKKMLDTAVVETQRYADKTGKLHDKATGRFVKGQKRMQSSLVTTGKFMKQLGSGMSGMGRSMTFRVTAPLTAMGVASVYQFGKFNQAMTESTSIMKVTENQMAQMKKTALDLSFSGDALQGPDALAKSYFFLASAGKNAEQSMALLPEVAKFATAGAFDMALATDLLTDAQSALGLSSKNVIEDAKNMARVSDVLVGANTLANASVQQFSTALTSKAGAAFKAYNIELEEGVALLAAYADQGIKAELAGNAADRMIRLLTKASRENADEFKRLGVSVFDASGEFLPFKKIIGSMEVALKDMSTEQKAAALTALGFEARVQSVILPLLGTSEAIGKYSKKLKEMSGITDEVAGKQMKSFANRMKVVWNQVKIVGIEIGELLVPYIEELALVLKAAINMWKGFSSWTKNAWVATGLLLAAIGPLLTIFATIPHLVGGAIIAFTALRAVIITSTAAAYGFNVALSLGVGAAAVAAIMVLRASIAKVNAELDAARAKTKTMASSRIASILGLEGDERAEAVERAGKKHMEAVKKARENLKEEEDKYRGYGPGSIYKNITSFVDAADTTGPLKKELEDVKAERKEFEDVLGREFADLQSKTGPGSIKAARAQEKAALRSFEEDDVFKRTAFATGLGGMTSGMIDQAQMGVEGYIQVFKGAGKYFSTTGMDNAKMFGKGWLKQQEIEGKAWTKKTEEQQAEITKTLTPQEQFAREAKRLEALGLDQAQLDKSLAYAKEQILEKLDNTKISIIPTIDTPEWGTVEAEARIMAFLDRTRQAGEPAAGGGGAVPKPVPLKDIVPSLADAKPLPMGEGKGVGLIIEELQQIVELNEQEVNTLDDWDLAPAEFH